MTRNPTVPIVAAFASVLLAACGAETSPTSADTAGTSAARASVYARAVDNPGRSAADRALDASRKPEQVLAFLGIAPGMKVLDLFSGGGYYSELTSYVVGDDGLVVAHSNDAYVEYLGDEFSARYGDGRLANVEVLMAENNELDLEAGSFDAVLMMLTFHDFYYVAPQRGWPKIDSGRLLAELYESLKPGGIVGIVDHFAEAGSPRETGNTLHRIDPGIVIAEMRAAGFKLDAKSDVLRNMHDDYGKVVFDPELRGKTDRFVMRFLKPE